MTSKELLQAIKYNDVGRLSTIAPSIGNLSEANISLEDTEDKNQREDRLTPLHYAALYDSLECFLYLQNTCNLPLRILSSRMYYPLHYACWSGSIEVALYILSRDPSQAGTIVQGGGDVQLIFCASQGGSAAILRTLLENGAVMPKDSQSIIDKAIGVQNIEVVEVLYKSLHSIHNDMPISMVTVENFNVEAFQLLYNGKDDIIYKSQSGMYRNLIGMICDLDSSHHMFKKILTQKVLHDAKNLFDVEPPKSEKEGLVHFACEYCDFDVLKQMIKLPGFQINRLDWKNRPGPAKFIGKKEKDHPDIVKMIQFLINNGFDVNNHAENEPSLLEMFVLTHYKNLKAIECLLLNGADMYYKCFNKSANGKSIFDFVMLSKYNNVKELFKKYSNLLKTMNKD